jgi:hypothetical protein
MESPIFNIKTKTNMKKLLFVIVMMAVGLCSCGGGKSGGSSSSDESGSSASDLAEGKWPAAVYDKYGIPEIETRGKIVCTDLSGQEDSYLYRVYYKGVTREEVQAWVKALKEKGFRIADWQQEKIDKSGWDYDIFLYQPEQGKDMRVRIGFDFDKNMDFEYYADEPNPAYEIVTRGEGDDQQMYIEYNFTVSLNKFKNTAETEGNIEALNLKAEDFAGIPGIRYVQLSNSMMGPSIDMNWFADHQLSQESFDAVHKKVLEVLTAKGCKFQHAFSGKELTPEELTAQGIHSYGVKLNDQQFTMMSMCDDRVGDFGGSIKFTFAKARK